MIGRFPLLKVPIEMISGGLYRKFWFKSVELVTDWLHWQAEPIE